MSYADENLMNGEAIVYQAKLHWAVFTGAITLGVLGLLLMVAGAGTAGVLFLILSAVVGLFAYIAANNSEFAVTNKRVLIKVGWLSRRSVEVLLTKVEGIGVEQDLSGKLFGYGTIVISGTGGTHERFKGIEAPFEFRKQVQEQVALVQDAPRIAESVSRPPPSGREERECPYCAETILAKARVCKHCGKEVQPLTA